MREREREGAKSMRAKRILRLGEVCECHADLTGWYTYKAFQ